MKQNILSITKIYENLIKPILKKDRGIDAEYLTNFSLNIIAFTSNKKDWPIISKVLKELHNELCMEDERLNQNICGINFTNPVGLAAGFDKNGIGANVWRDFGFGFAEIGTVTKHAQVGNPKPRLFRISKEGAALNRMGFNNKGADLLVKNLISQNIQKSNQRVKNCLGINFGKSKITPLKQSTEDYVYSLKLLIPYCDYATINVSSPNTEGLRRLQDPLLLRELLIEIKKLPECPPLFIKIAPDLNFQEIDDICQLITDVGADGIIATNTSIDRLGLEKTVIQETGINLSNESGGLSGRPLRAKANRIIKYIHNNDKKIVLIGVGGIDSAKSAWERICSGASLVQLYTGWIYQGPILVPHILSGLVKQLNIHKIANIKEAVGSGLNWEE